MDEPKKEEGEIPAAPAAPQDPPATPPAPAAAAEPEPEVDLEKLRDERCIPVARMVLNDMAVDMKPINAQGRKDFQPLVMKLLQRSLDADLNLVMENPYIFQLILSVFSGLNTTVQECATAPIDDERYTAIAKKILGFVAVADIKMGNRTPDETTAAFAPIKAQLEALFAEEKLSWLEIKYIMDNIFQSFKATQQIFAENVEMSVQRMEAKILGVDTMSDLTMKRLNEVLVTPSKPAEPAAPAAGAEAA